MLSELLDLLVPRRCAGCGAETVSLCADCLCTLEQPVRIVMPRYGTRPVVGAGMYSGVMREVIVAFKSRDRRDLSPILGLLLARAVVAALQLTETRAAPVLLVPVPSTRAAVAARGLDHVLVLAQAAATALRADGLQVAAAPVLRVAAHRDQVGLRAGARNRNVRDSHALTRAAAPVVACWQQRARVVLIDDIVTTGSTLAEAARVLRRAGCAPEVCAVVGIAPGERPAGQSDDV